MEADVFASAEVCVAITDVSDDEEEGAEGGVEDEEDGAEGGVEEGAA